MPFENVAQLWYPPREVVTRRGRFNERGETMFYASNTAVGALFEIRPKLGDIITLLVARPKSAFTELECAQIGLERSVAPEIASMSDGWKPWSSPRFQEMLSNAGVTNKWQKIDGFLCELATRSFPPETEQADYVMTNAVSKLLFLHPSVEAIHYPSIATRLNALNLYILPQAADSRFFAHEAWMVRIDEQANALAGIPKEADDDIFYRTTFFKRSLRIAEDGRITWSRELTDVRLGDISHIVRRGSPPPSETLSAATDPTQGR